MKEFAQLYRVLESPAGAIRVLVQKYIQRKSIIDYAYKGHALYINNEDSAIFHIVNSTKKIENLVNQIIKEPQVVLDVGANNGLFTYFLKTRFPDATVHLFEPDAELCKSIVLNCQQFTDIHVHQIAVSNQTGKIRFYINPSSRQTNSMHLACIENYSSNLIEAECEAITLDEFMQRHQLKHIDVLKVDIQGAESFMIDGGSNALKNTEVCFLEVTFLDHNALVTLDKIRLFFNRHKVINPVHMGADLIFYNDLQGEGVE